jgi:hypothetical protein
MFPTAAGLTGTKSIAYEVEDEKSTENLFCAPAQET